MAKILKRVPQHLSLPLMAPCSVTVGQPSKPENDVVC